ncbi:MAG: putative secreted protein [Marmoricola sp.]|nr:putative secreted protein [Marmoricola sp.]
MNKATKGAAAAAAAGVVLLGGAGSLAYWNSQQTITGTSIQSGRLNLALGTCGDWQLDATGGTGGDLDGREIVPGDSLSRVCTYTLTAEGDHLAANLDVATPEWSGALADSLVTSAVFKINGGTFSNTTVVAGTPVALAAGGPYAVTATFSVDFPFGSTVDNSSQDVSAALSDITLTATQTDNHS